jgi:hypothetical protein
MMRAAILSLAFLSSAALFAQETATYQSFDVPGSVNTYAVAINESATTAGYSVDASGVHHGFVRSAAGVLTPFNDIDAGFASNRGTLAMSINDSGTATGYFSDSHFRHHAFERSAAVRS